MSGQRRSWVSKGNIKIKGAVLQSATLRKITVHSEVGHYQNSIKMRIYSYVLKHDSGFAPNPFGEYCTLACCKPKVRKAAMIGDWVVGTGSVNNIGQDQLIYAMKISEKLTFAQYCKDKRFLCKIPSKGQREERGDNIYYTNDKEDIIQRKSYHIEKDMERDLSVDSILVSSYYYYFGKNGVVIPDNFKVIIKNGPGHKCNFDQDFIISFVTWLQNRFPVGLQGEPFDYKERLSDIALSCKMKRKHNSTTYHSVKCMVNPNRILPKGA